MANWVILEIGMTESVVQYLRIIMNSGPDEHKKMLL